MKARELDYHSPGELSGKPVRSDYSWQCLICGASNAAASGACVQCGFPARATGHQIAKAKAEHGSGAAQVSEVALKAEGSYERLSALLAPLSTWRQVLTVVGIALAAVGGLTFKIAWSFAGLGWGALALTGGLIVVGIAVADKQAPSSESNGAE